MIFYVIWQQDSKAKAEFLMGAKFNADGAAKAFDEVLCIT